MKKKACRECKILVTSSEGCPLCKGSTFVVNWKGRIIVLDSGKSKVAEKMNLTTDGEYAIKVS